jgi:hypothetical protein
MLFFTSIYFLITTLPVSIFFVVDSFVKDPDNNLTTAKLKLAKAVLYLLQFSNYAVNFYIFKIFYKLYKVKRARVRVMVFNPTLNNIAAISWRSVLLVEETGLPGESHRPPANH